MILFVRPRAAADGMSADETPTGSSWTDSVLYARGKDIRTTQLLLITLYSCGINARNFSRFTYLRRCTHARVIITRTAEQTLLLVLAIVRFRTRTCLFRYYPTREGAGQDLSPSHDKNGVLITAGPLLYLRGNARVSEDGR